MTGSALDQLAARYGLGSAYHDYRGELKVFSAATRMALLAAMGVATDSWWACEQARDAYDAELDKQAVPRVKVLRQHAPQQVEVSARALAGYERLHWILQLETGEHLEGSVVIASLAGAPEGLLSQPSVNFELTEDLPFGYHQLVLRTEAHELGRVNLIVTPARCFEPAALKDDRRLWGVTLQLYTLRSDSNWGIGDFGDLCEVIECAAPSGCALVGLNPLHALLPADPALSSPYSPSSRRFLNVLYIAVPLVPEFKECTAAGIYVESEQETLTRLRSTANVDYVAVAKIKLHALRLLHEHFRTQHLTANTPRARMFREFAHRGGESLRLHAAFDALHAHLRGHSSEYGGWPDWPEAYRNPDSAEVRRFTEEHETDVDFHLFLQWLAAGQLEHAQRLAKQKGLSLGLYGDVAVGVNPGGSETWANRRLYVMGAAIGAPPDPLALKGQDWGIPPQNPRELKAQLYQPFIDLLRLNMQFVAALRLDHVMALFRQWWVPQGVVAVEGAYVHYPLDDLMSILALESWRNRCLVIGEDLGTVPDAVREAMQRYGVAHYKVLLFEREADGNFKSPAAYERGALAAVTTHDLPTFRGWWEGLDIELAIRLNLYPDDATRKHVQAERATGRHRFMAALAGARLWHWQERDGIPPASHALVRAAHLYLALSRAAIAVVQIEDLAGMVDPVNVPGTHTEHANWQRKVSAQAMDIFSRPENLEMLAAIGIARTGQNPN